jgi:predicted esterase
VAHGTPLSKIALCGFSQGGALALHVALRYGHHNHPTAAARTEATSADAPGAEATEAAATAEEGRLAGCVALSAW